MVLTTITPCLPLSSDSAPVQPVFDPTSSLLCTLEKAAHGPGKIVTMISGSLVVADLYSVNGLIAVVTGGATSMGLVMAKTLEANGAKVYILGRRKAALEEAAKQSVSTSLLHSRPNPVLSPLPLSALSRLARYLRGLIYGTDIETMLNTQRT